MEYNFKKIEEKWQEKWLKEKVFRATEDSKKEKYYQLETFPYPSAAGLHVGHPKGYIAEDLNARYQRMKGKNVLYTMGWDAFGLPTENYAIKVGRSPKEVAEESVKNFKRQVQMFGLSYAWDREINTSSPEYYKWTQWLFIQLYKKGLAYRAKAKVNWCPKDQTVLANEQVVGGKCERCGADTEQKEMEQWFLKITNYVERLLGDLDGLIWPEATIKRQKDWIGRSEGAEIEFGIKNSDLKIKVFTTRPDTIFGATYLVLAPENNLLQNKELGIENYEEVQNYIKDAKNKKELERLAEGKEKTGIEVKGLMAVNPATKKEIPIWVADYVLGSYGTGAIMAVPAHDERDFDFAKKFNLPILQVISSGAREDLYVGEGTLINSGEFDGMNSEEAKWKIAEFVGGQKKIQYKLRDWSVSRQRYWGVPIPMIHCEKCGINPVPEKDLPVLLPDLKDFRPQGMPPLESSEEFIKTSCPNCGGEAKRDSETLDTFVDSSWYFLRYTDSHNEKEIFDKLKANYWMPVDLYVIGAEHTVLHLLYSRFITKFLQDEGYLDFSEPFKKLRHVGLILGTDNQKMSKSRGNVINPDDLIGEFGADAFRVYEMFMGPFNEGQPWDPKGIIGSERFLRRVWKFFCRNGNANLHNLPAGRQAHSNTTNLEKLLHKTIKKVTEDIDGFSFNTAVSALMIFLNEAEKQNEVSVSKYQDLIKLIYPFAPHMAEEIWHEILGNKTYLHEEKWPEYDEAMLREDQVNVVVQVNGKVRDTIVVSTDLDEEGVRKMALESEKVSKFIGNNEIKKVIFVQGKLINFVV